RRRLEHAAILSARRQRMVGTTAETEIEVREIAVRRDVSVPRHADRFECVVGEQADRAVYAGAVVVTGEAVALLGVVIDGQPSSFLRREFAAGLVARIAIVPAR